MAADRGGHVCGLRAAAFQTPASGLKLRYHAEAWLLRNCIRLVRALPVETASNLGGLVARALGRILPVSRVIDTNLQLALPALDPAGRRRVSRDVWDNLGRNAVELPLLASLRQTTHGPGWEITGEEHLRAQAARGGPAIFVSGHIGNWEMLPPIVAHYGIVFSSIYRPSNNPEVDRIVMGLRHDAVAAARLHAEAATSDPVELFVKGIGGARAIYRHLSSGYCLGALVDQKMNEGIEARLFGMKAMTASGSAALAVRLRCPVIPGYIQRLAPARFRLVCEAPLRLPETGDRNADVTLLTQQINDCLERWITARPGSWLWLHRRWDKRLYKTR